MFGFVFVCLCRIHKKLRAALGVWQREGGPFFLGVQAGASLALEKVPVNGGVEEAGEGVPVHERVDLQLGLLIHEPAGLRQALIDALSHTRVQAHLQRETQTCLKVWRSSAKFYKFYMEHM